MEQDKSVKYEGDKAIVDLGRYLGKSPLERERVQKALERCVDEILEHKGVTSIEFDFSSVGKARSVDITALVYVYRGIYVDRKYGDRKIKLRLSHLGKKDQHPRRIIEMSGLTELPEVEVIESLDDI